MGNSIKKMFISALLGGAILLMAAYFQFGLIFAPAIIGFLGAAWGTSMALIPVAISLAGLLAIGGAESLLTAVLFVPAGIIIWVCLKKRYAYRTTVSLSAAAEVLALYGLTCLPSVLGGGTPFDAYTEYMAVFGDAMKTTVDQMALGEETVQMIERLAAQIEVMAPDIAVMTMFTMGMISGLACTLLARWACKKAKAEVKPMAHIAHWQLTREFSKGSLVLILGALICSLAGINNASAVVVAIECIVGGPYILMGICLVAFAVKYRTRGGGVLALAIAGMVLMLPYSLYGLAFMGMADRLFGLRRNPRETGRR